MSSWRTVGRCVLGVGHIIVLAACGGGGGGGGGGVSPPSTTTPAPASPQQVALSFTEVALSSGLTREWGYVNPLGTDPEFMAGGVAAVDYDGDGDTDLYVVGGDAAPNMLFQNQGNGQFVEMAASVGLDLNHKGSGPTFADIDGDGDLDLFVGAVEGDAFYLMENRNGQFVDVTAASGIFINALNTFSAAFGDYDGDGDLDLALSHWGNPEREDTETLWRNTGTGTFEAASEVSRVAALLIDSADPAELQIRSPALRNDNSFTPNFSDIDGDGDLDLLIASDFRTSQVLGNDGDGTFSLLTNRDVIKDQAGMGAAVFDYDNDGDMDWFVTSIFRLDESTDEVIGYGNRLYENDGAGSFSDVTDAAGVRDGGWGWGSCAADFDNDGHQDLFHVNGWRRISSRPENDYTEDRARLFRANGSGGFSEQAQRSGLTDRGQGRGVACFDAEGDGDIDIVITNNDDNHLVLYRNDTERENHYIGVRLEDEGIGAKVVVSGDGRTQTQEVRAGSNYVSQNPIATHFGLGGTTQVDVTVHWLDGTRTVVNDVAVDRVITIGRSGLPQAFALTVLQGQGGGQYRPGDQIDVTAEPAQAGYYFSRWSIEGEGVLADPTSATTTLTMPEGPVSLIARYVPGVAPDAEVSVLRRWMEVLLQAIRNDFARPTVHARNLFHASAAAYDAWSAHTDVSGGSELPWLFGRTRAGVNCADAGFVPTGDLAASRAEAISYAVYRLIEHRFAASPGSGAIRRDAEALMSLLDFDPLYRGADSGRDATAAQLGNHIAQCYIEFGLVDGSNEQNDYANQVYSPVNPPLAPDLPGNPDIVDLNRWQPLNLQEFIDQAGNAVSDAPEFLSPEWGQVYPFSLSEANRTTFARLGETYEYRLYHDPGEPPKIDGTLSESFKWAHSMVSIWSSHLDPSGALDSGIGAEMIDISPASIGNVESLPATFEDYPQFYNTLMGGDAGSGHALNPVTGIPYDAQIVPRADYARVLAEFWADGPDSETPPGHWFVILNEVNDHPMLERRLGGSGLEVGLLEWDVKAYFALGGAMHDAAIAAWGAKGWYDYIRPISSIRAMADLGQSSDPGLASYHVDGIRLEPGYIELVESGDALAGENGEHVGKIKLLAWRGPEFVIDPDQDIAGVGWILAENWWPYQRPSFVTPPFAGYVSGHSVYSRVAAEVLTALTGDPFFPGGMSGFEIPADEFLVFERGPSVAMTLQWATYRDAADQCSLSRIWGGIHPPVDDIPGRLMGIKIGIDGYEEARAFWEGARPL